MNLSLEFVFGIVVTIILAVIGYFVRNTDKKIDDADSRCGRLETELAETRHVLRNEMNNIVLNEEKRRTEAIHNLESRFNVQIERVINLINSKHVDLKSDMQTLHDDLRLVLAK